MSAIDRLAALIPPPTVPREISNASSWEQICAQVGTSLPSDLRELTLRFGSGRFAGNDFYIANPLATWYPTYVERECERTVDSIEAGLFDRPYKVFPDHPGLYPIGADENGNQMFWLTNGKPDKWPIILHGHGHEETEQWEFPLCDFLLKLFTNEIRCLIWPDGFQSDQLNFTPS